MDILEEKKNDFVIYHQYVKQVLEVMILIKEIKKELLVHVLNHHLKEIKLIKVLDQILDNID